MRKGPFVKLMLVPGLLAFAGYAASAAQPAPISAQGTAAAALGSAARAKVGATAPAPTVKPAEGGASATPPVPDMTVTDAICGNYSRPATAEERAGCSLFAGWFNSQQSLHTSQNRQNPTPPRVQNGKLLIVAIHNAWPQPKVFPLPVPKTGVATPGTDDADLKGRSYYDMIYTYDGQKIVLTVEVTPYGGTPTTRQYDVISGQPLRIEMGFGDYITVDPELRDATPAEVRQDCNQQALNRFVAANPRPALSEGQQAVSAYSDLMVRAQAQACP